MNKLEEFCYKVFKGWVKKKDIRVEPDTKTKYRVYITLHRGLNKDMIWNIWENATTDTEYSEVPLYL